MTEASLKRLRTIWILMLWHSEKGKTIKTDKISTASRGSGKEWEEEERCISRAQRILTVVKLILYEAIIVDLWHYEFTKAIDCTTPRVNVNVSYKQYWIIMYRWWFINYNMYHAYARIAGLMLLRGCWAYGNSVFCTIFL